MRNPQKSTVVILTLCYLYEARFLFSSDYVLIFLSKYSVTFVTVMSVNQPKMAITNAFLIIDRVHS